MASFLSSMSCSHSLSRLAAADEHAYRCLAGHQPACVCPFLGSRNLFGSPHSVHALAVALCLFRGGSSSTRCAVTVAGWDGWSNCARTSFVSEKPDMIMIRHEFCFTSEDNHTVRCLILEYKRARTRMGAGGGASLGTWGASVRDIRGNISARIAGENRRQYNCGGVKKHRRVEQHRPSCPW